MNNVYVLFINSALINEIMSVGYQENIKAKKKPEIGLYNKIQLECLFGCNLKVKHLFNSLI